MRRWLLGVFGATLAASLFAGGPARCKSRRCPGSTTTRTTTSPTRTGRATARCGPNRPATRTPARQPTWPTRRSWKSNGATSCGAGCGSTRGATSGLTSSKRVPDHRGPARTTGPALCVSGVPPMASPLLAFTIACGYAGGVHADPLPNTQPLTFTGDLAAAMVAGIDKYLDREMAASVEKRKQYWKPDFSSPEAYAKSVAAEPRAAQEDPRRRRPAPAAGDWSTSARPTDAVARRGGDGLQGLRRPLAGAARRRRRGAAAGARRARRSRTLVALPDADRTPEMLVGLAPGVPRRCQFARPAGRERLPRPRADADRPHGRPGPATPRLNRWTNQPHREFIYRMAFEMGRHVIGYEVQKVLAGGRLVRRAGRPGRTRRSASSATAKAGCSPCWRRPSTTRIDVVGCQRLLRPREATSGRSRSTATSGACCASSATPSCRC